MLAEFGYGGKLLPTFPSWLIDGTRPSRLAWLLKERMLPPIYWKAMLKGHEWLAKPRTHGLTRPHADARARPTDAAPEGAVPGSRLGAVLSNAATRPTIWWRQCIVTVMLIPQSLAYAMLAGLPP